MADNGTRRGIEAQITGPADPVEMDSLMRRFFDQNRDQTAEGVAPTIVLSAVKDAGPRRDFDMASELLERASQAFDLLIDRCQRFEHDLEEAQERAREEALGQADTIEQ